MLIIIISTIVIIFGLISTHTINSKKLVKKDEFKIVDTTMDRDKLFLFSKRYNIDYNSMLKIRYYLRDTEDIRKVCLAIESYRRYNTIPLWYILEKTYGENLKILIADIANNDSNSH